VAHYFFNVTNGAAFFFSWGVRLWVPPSTRSGNRQWGNRPISMTGLFWSMPRRMVALNEPRAAVDNVEHILLPHTNSGQA